LILLTNATPHVLYDRIYLRSANVCAKAHIHDRPDTRRHAECVIYINTRIHRDIQKGDASNKIHLLCHSHYNTNHSKICNARKFVPLFCNTKKYTNSQYKNVSAVLITTDFTEKQWKRNEGAERLWQDYGVATISRLPKNIGLFCKRALLKRLYSVKETYNLKEPNNCSYPIRRKWGYRVLVFEDK